MFIVGLGSLMLSITLVFALMGYWMMLPFAGVEFLAVFAALYLTVKSNSRCQVVSIATDTVTVEKGRTRSQRTLKKGPDEVYSFPRLWIRIEFNESLDAERNHLFLASGSTRVEIGEFLLGQERIVLADYLKCWLQTN